MSDITEGNKIEVTIKRVVGSLIKYERDNEGLRDKLEVPYRKKWANAKFTLPSGKKKCEEFGYEQADEEIISMLNKRYSNFRNLFAIDKTTLK